jgi:hypothetical protein
MYTAQMAIPPNVAADVAGVSFRLLDTTGASLAEHPARIEPLAGDGPFLRAVAQWPVDSAAPGAFLLVGEVRGKSGEILARVAPRLVSVNNTQGY